MDSGFIVYNDSTYPFFRRLARRARSADAGDRDEHVDPLRWMRSRIRRRSRGGRGAGTTPVGRHALVREDARRDQEVLSAGQERRSPMGTTVSPCVNSWLKGDSPPISSAISWFRVVSSVWSAATGSGLGVPGSLPLHLPRESRHAVGHGFTAMANDHGRLAGLRRTARQGAPRGAHGNSRPFRLQESQAAASRYTMTATTWPFSTAW